MSARTIELFRQYTDKDQLNQEPEHKAQKAEEQGEELKKPNLVLEMSRMQQALHQLFDDASPAERDNIIRFLEVVISNLKRMRKAANE